MYILPVVFIVAALSLALIIFCHMDLDTDDVITYKTILRNTSPLMQKTTVPLDIFKEMTKSYTVREYMI